MDRFEFFQKLPAMSSFDRQRVLHAYNLTKLAHCNQFRDTGEEYFEHALGVTLILMGYEYADAHQLILGLTHDVLEKSFVTLSFLERLFGHEIASDISALSKKFNAENLATAFTIQTVRKTNEAYYEGLARSNERVIIAKCADRIHNLSSFPRADDEGRWPQERRIGKILETRQYIIPLAERYNERMAVKLAQLCTELEVTAERIISSRPPPRNE